MATKGNKKKNSQCEKLQLCWMEQVPLRFLHPPPPSLEQPHQRTLLPISATVKHSGHFLCRTRPCIIGPGKYHLNNWTADNSLEQWMGGCRGETAVQTPCLTAHYTPPSPPPPGQRLSLQRMAEPSLSWARPAACEGRCPHFIIK